MSVRILHGDMLAILPTLEADSIHAVVTDPPYELGFMGRKWDSTGIAFRPETWALVYAAMKPGAHLVAFGSSRGYHRMTCAIEDAGFEIRDTLCWLYGSGFPKSHDVAKGIDKTLGVARTEVVGIRPGHEDFVNRIDRHSAGARREGWDRPWKDDPEAVRMHHLQTAPATSEAASWEGWGSALKPAFEPIILARKPLEGTIAANVLQHGCGGINIDECRIPFSGDADEDEAKTKNQHAAFGSRPRDNQIYGKDNRDQVNYDPPGRFPANVLHDGSDEVMEAFAAFGKRGNGPNARVMMRGVKPDRDDGYGMDTARATSASVGGDTGSAARFFYCAKADSDDRAGSKHPTVKPLALMSWLVKLITPPGGTILDPFAGSGTTLLAADRLQFNAIGIEQSAEYVADIKRRMQADSGLFAEIATQ